jgi:hypothetical protein
MAPMDVAPNRRQGAGPGCELAGSAAAPYGPIRQFVSVQGWEPSHCENVVLKPITPKPNVARMISFVIVDLFESGVPAKKN